MISEVHNCDCMEYMRSLPDNYFELVIADPPFGSGDPHGTVTKYNRFGGRFCSYKSPNDAGRCRAWDVAPPQEYFDELFRVSKNQIIWGGNYFSLSPTRCFLVWRKTTISEKFSMAMAEYAWTSFFDCNAKVFDFPPQRNDRSGKFHPTEKPLELYGWCLDLFAKPGDRIFDPNMGSQSSRIAAYIKDFDFYGCEIDGYYFEKGNERFERVCHGVNKLKNGKSVRQTSLF